MENLSIAESTQKMAELYESGMTLEEIGALFGMTRQGVRHRFVKAGIERRRPESIDKKQLEILYSKKRLPIFKIAGIFSVSESKIKRALKSYGIPKREPLKPGGYNVDFLRSLRIEQPAVIKWRNEEYAHLHDTAKRIGIKISIKALGGRKFEVVRLGLWRRFPGVVQRNTGLDD